jgi:hypothetical protein
MFSSWDLIFCFQSGFWWIHLHTVSILFPWNPTPC